MTFSKRLEQLGFSTYSDYLKSDHWLRFRREYKNSGNQMTCLVCMAKPIQLHHQTYARIGKERFTDVTPLCGEHHEAVHEWLKSSGRISVKYTHEAVVALGGTFPPFFKTIKASKKAKGTNTHPPKRSKQKIGDITPVESCRVSKAARPLIEKLFALPLTQRQMRSVNRFALSNDLPQLAGILKSLGRPVEPQVKNPVSNRKCRQNDPPPKKQKSKQTPPLVASVERVKWSDPLQAIRMLANGHRPPPKQNGTAGKG